ncbi:hypothetical protein H4219_006439 [Mycoemilia scoparia]|uniref:Uncharacterized protein n=1 Tax=Mycoemilia scoparia TaxID=417184 RepID=A0A9W8DIJ9_9FUNG|nr:hypothetical protein H4219_006439 [Mycoemilia scoparia]
MSELETIPYPAKFLSKEFIWAVEKIFDYDFLSRNNNSKVTVFHRWLKNLFHAALMKIIPEIIEYFKKRQKDGIYRYHPNSDKLRGDGDWLLYHFCISVIKELWWVFHKAIEQAFETLIEIQQFSKISVRKRGQLQVEGEISKDNIDKFQKIYNRLLEDIKILEAFREFLFKVKIPDFIFQSYNMYALGCLNLINGLFKISEAIFANCTSALCWSAVARQYLERKYLDEKNRYKYNRPIMNRKKL